MPPFGSTTGKAGVPPSTPELSPGGEGRPERIGTPPARARPSTVLWCSPSEENLRTSVGLPVHHRWCRSHHRDGPDLPEELGPSPSPTPSRNFLLDLPRWVPGWQVAPHPWSVVRGRTPSSTSTQPPRMRRRVHVYLTPFASSWTPSSVRISTHRTWPFHEEPASSISRTSSSRGKLHPNSGRSSSSSPTQRIDSAPGDRKLPDPEAASARQESSRRQEVSSGAGTPAASKRKPIRRRPRHRSAAPGVHYSLDESHTPLHPVRVQPGNRQR